MGRSAVEHGVARSGDAVGGDIPRVFDDLEIRGLAGRGGMGRVYVAQDVLLDRPVAVKVVDVEQDEEARAQIIHEARMLARLSHPNVVAVYRVGDVGGRPYIAYEHIEGVPLDELDVPLATAEALKVGVGLARGLAAVHARGILHRDVKPANAMLAVSGDVKLLDFGIAQARAHRDAREDGTPVDVSKLAAESTWDRAPTETLESAPERTRTRAGIVVGTPRYLAPERWSGAPASTASDVFAFGVVLYELLAGRLGRDGLPSLAKDGLPPLRTRAPHVPDDLATLVESCLAPAPDARPTSMAVVRDRLEAMSVEVVRDPNATADAETTPEIAYTRAGDVSVAYSAVGAGRQTIVVVPPFVTNLDATWAWDELAGFYRELGEGRRLVLYDKRGTGLSDRAHGVGGLDARLADLRAVMDAAGVERATIFGMSEGVPAAIAWAALNPERTDALVLYGGSARGLGGPDFPAGPPPEAYEHVFQLIASAWGKPILLEIEAPSVAEDETFRRRWSNFLRVSASPGAATEVLAISRDLDVSHLLAAVRVPTLVLHREGDRLVPTEAARLLAARIPGAELALLPGEDHMPMVGDRAALVGAVHRFLERAQTAVALPAARIGTFIALGIDDPDALPAAAREAWRQRCVRASAVTLEARAGVPTAMSIHGLASGLMLANDLAADMRARGIAIRAGVATGDIDERSAESGVAAARRLVEAAAEGEVRVSRELAGVLAGTGVRLEPASGDGIRVRP